MTNLVISQRRSSSDGRLSVDLSPTSPNGTARAGLHRGLPRNGRGWAGGPHTAVGDREGPGQRHGSRVERKSVKLSNWAHAVKNAEPFFFVVIRFDFPEDDVPEVADVFVVHVDRDWCGRVLKRLREQTNESEPLHKQTVDLTWREDEGIVAPFAENLDIRMREMIGEPHEYTRRKLNWFGTVGYEPDRFHLSFTPDAVDVDTACRRLADFAIGLEKQLPLRSAAISDVRFGKAIPVQEFEGAAPQYLEMTAQRPHGRATVDIDLLDGTDSVTLNCDGYASHLVFPELPKEYLKIRCIAGPVELIFDARNGMHFRFVGNHDDKRSLRDLARAAKSLRLIVRGMPVGLRVQLRLNDYVKPYVLEFSGEAREVDAALQEWAQVMEAAGDVATGLGVDTDTIVAPAQLMREAGSLLWLRLAFRADMETMGVTVTPFDHDQERVERIAFCDTIPVAFGEVGVLALVVMDGAATWHEADGTDLNVTVSGCRPRVYRRWRAEISKLDAIDTTEAERQLNAELDRRKIALVITDFLHPGQPREHPAFTTPSTEVDPK
jgi:hypothetical protein